MPDNHELPSQTAPLSGEEAAAIGRVDRHPTHSSTGAEAGPSRSSNPLQSQPDPSTSPQQYLFRSHSQRLASQTPTSPSSELSPLSSCLTFHLNISEYPTQHLLKLLANLLQHIASSNDDLRSELEVDRDEEDEEEYHHDRSSSTAGATNSRPLSGASAWLNDQRGPSPTKELFAEAAATPASYSTSSRATQTTYPLSQFPLFTASKASLSRSSALLSFHARHIPSISIEAYLLRILKYCPTTNEVFLGVLVYFDRMTKLGTPVGIGGESAKAGKRGEGFAIDSYNVHRLVIAGVTVASKFFSDVFYTNSRYAKVGGLPPTELNSLELQFLLLNDFRLRISVEEMQGYGDRLLAYAHGAGDEIATVGIEVRRSDSRKVGDARKV
ncbi:hypothetical protein L204_105699 [Cryptococcus depauperatus]|nr:glycogen storage control protein [Cryptococcus depauperatus CBS 7855]